jgi:hypothetical protein
MKNKYLGSLIIALVLLSTVMAHAFTNNISNPVEDQRDSVIIKFGNNSRILVYFDDKEELEKLQNLDINKILKDLSLSIDTAGSNRQLLTITDKTGKKYLKDTTIVVEKSRDFTEVERKFNSNGSIKEFDVKDFNAVEAGIAFTINIRQGQEFSVKAKGRPEDLDLVNAKVIGNGKLVLDLGKSGFSTNNIQKIEFLIVTPSLTSVDISGASSVFVKGFQEREMDIELSGASKGEFDVQAEHLKVSLSGASNAKMYGKGASARISASGASQYNGYNYIADEVRAKSSGASRVNVYANNELNATSSGASSITYKGKPSIKYLSSGAGSVRSSDGKIKSTGPAGQIHFAENPSSFKRNRRMSTSQSFNVELGLNNYLQNGRFPEATNENFSLNPLGSRYFGLSSIWDTHIKGPLSIEWGANLTWYNFRFDDKTIKAVNTPEGIDFMEAVDAGAGIRSKLTAVFLGGQVVPMIHLGSKKGSRASWPFEKHRYSGFRIGAGGYAGYRIDSYSRFVFSEGGEKRKEREKGNFGLNNFRYGVRAQMGYRGVDLFANYDLNKLFYPDRGPELNAFSFGIIF